jgi:hypothetical protein
LNGQRGAQQMMMHVQVLADELRFVQRTANARQKNLAGVYDVTVLIPLL